MARHGATHGDEQRAGLGAAADLAEPAGAVARDEGQIGERLDVLDERRASAHAALERSRGREGRFGGSAVQPLDEGALLAGHEAVGHGYELDLLTRSGLGALVDGDREGSVRRRCVSSHGDDDPASARDGGRDHRAVEHEVRIDPHQQCVLVTRRLTFDAVCDDDRRAPRRDRPQFDVCRETCAAAPSQTAGFDFGKQCISLAPQHRQRAVALEVGAQRGVGTRGRE